MYSGSVADARTKLIQDGAKASIAAGRPCILGALPMPGLPEFPVLFQHSEVGIIAFKADDSGIHCEMSPALPAETAEIVQAE